MYQRLHVSLGNITLSLNSCSKREINKYLNKNNFKKLLENRKTSLTKKKLLKIGLVIKNVSISFTEF